MIVEQNWTANAWRNFNYIVACEETGEALAIDPLDHQKCLGLARERGWTVRQVLNTHEHGDHTGGNAAMVAATGAQVLAHVNAAPAIREMTRGLQAGDVITVGRTVELECLDTPGHTMAHVCLLSRTQEPALFSGDTLFNAGAGNCHNGGHPRQLYQTFVGQLAKLPETTRIYPGHDYLARNLAFTLDREPSNDQARGLIEEAERMDPAHAVVTTLGLEKEINVFFRLQNAEVIRQLRAKLPDLPANPTAEDVFLALRELRNKW